MMWTETRTQNIFYYLRRGSTHIDRIKTQNVNRARVVTDCCNLGHRSLDLETR